MGFPGQNDNKEVQKVVDESLKRISAKGKISGAIGNKGNVKSLYENGVKFYLCDPRPYMAEGFQKYQDFAASEAATFQGALAKLTNAFTAIKVSIGNAFLAGGQLTSIFDAMTNAAFAFAANADFSFIANALRKVAQMAITVSQGLLKAASAIAMLTGNDSIKTFAFEGRLALEKMKTA